MITPSIQKTTQGLGFFSAGCSLSNFYKCSVFYNGVSFKSVEHGYQGFKARTCHAPGIFNKITSTDSPSQAKTYAEDIFVTDEWDQKKIAIMKELLLCKFKQNQDLYFKLLNTHPQPLLECNLDEYWGTGCRLKWIAAVEGCWQRQNRLGELLVEVRDKIA